jgi:hypothetical protein
MEKHLLVRCRIRKGVTIYSIFFSKIPCQPYWFYSAFFITFNCCSLSSQYHLSVVEKSCNAIRIINSRSNLRPIDAKSEKPLLARVLYL